MTGYLGGPEKTPEVLKDKLDLRVLKTKAAELAGTKPD